MNPQIIEFEAAFGDQTRTVKVTNHGKQPRTYDIYIDNFCQGTMYFKNGTWLASLKPETAIEGDDIGILGDLIEEKLNG